MVADVDDKKRPEKDHADPVAIPLDAETALRALLAVKPDDEPLAEEKSGGDE
jgi:hypothetical protein